MGARVIDHDRNLGKAAAVRTAIRAARGERLVLMDADGTYPASAALQIVRLLDRYDIVFGARERGRANIPLLNRLGNGFFGFALRRISGLRLADPLTGLYGLHRQHLAAMDLDADGFAVEAEIVVRAGQLGLRSANLPIAYRARAGQSKLHPLRDGLAIAGTIVRVAFGGRTRRRDLRTRAAAPSRRDV
jgi:glycosyltransferase involved in cell wall biosynthesis